MILLPIRTDTPIKRTPYVNYGLIAINVLIFVVVDLIMDGMHRGTARQVKFPLMLLPAEPRISQFITYQFLHADKWHLLGNMFFLWIFGNSVNSKMGNVTYALFYLATGVFAGLGFALAGSTSPCLGASGSIAGITTAFLALFPRSEITVFYFFFIYMGTMAVNSLVWILGKMVLWDNYFAMQLSTGEYTSVAYEAHLAGYVAGFALALLMLAIRALPRDQFDVVALIRRWYQRRSFAAAMSTPEARAKAQFGRVASTGQNGPARDAAATDLVAGLRGAVREAINRGDFTSASERYSELIAAAPAEVLSQRDQLHVANQLMTLGCHAAAADAYERLLASYPMLPERTQVRLILGILYVRYLQRYDRAAELLSLALATLSDAAQRQQAEQWLQTAIDQRTSAPQP